MNRQILALLGIALVSMATLNGCTLRELRQQAIEAESLSSITGQVVIENDAPGELYVQAYRVVGTNFEMLRNHPAGNGDRFQLNLFPDQYGFSAYIDTNGNATLDPGEHGTYLGAENHYPRLLDIQAQDTKIPTMTISGPMDKPRNISIKESLGSRMKNAGAIRSLDDPMFAPPAATMALWRPLDFINEYGGGVLFLEPYDVRKTPVVFIHGIGGSAREFQDIIAGMDRARFQPWVYQYPSGLSLGPTADFLIHALARIHTRHQFKNVIVVAHSMGGLVARDFVQKHSDSEDSYDLSLAITINSPLLGMDSAAMGVKRSPLTIPSWRDIATGSDFIRDIHAKPWPANVPYHLVFSYLPYESGDGTVPLKSQLSRPLQQEADGIHGFEAGHASILREPEFIVFLQEQLAEAAMLNH